jgi:ligand-binding SRPBCC domain-containing protein
MSVNRLIYTQKISAAIEEVWDFFADPMNLVFITPQEMHMRITNEGTIGRLQKGMIISYKLFPFFDFPVKWSTRITHVDRPRGFEDEQEEGPYEFWHHRHVFKEVPGGVEVTDIIEYKIPFGLFGKMLDMLLIQSRLEYVFAYRRRKIGEIFGETQAA